MAQRNKKVQTEPSNAMAMPLPLEGPCMGSLEVHIRYPESKLSQTVAVPLLYALETLQDEYGFGACKCNAPDQGLANRTTHVPLQLIFSNA